MSFAWHLHLFFQEIILENVNAVFCFLRVQFVFLLYIFCITNSSTYLKFRDVIEFTEHSGFGSHLTFIESPVAIS